MLSLLRTSEHPTCSPRFRTQADYHGNISPASSRTDDLVELGFIGMSWCVGEDILKICVNPHAVQRVDQLKTQLAALLPCSPPVCMVELFLVQWHDTHDIMGDWDDSLEPYN